MVTSLSFISRCTTSTYCSLRNTVTQPFSFCTRPAVLPHIWGLLCWNAPFCMHVLWYTGVKMRLPFSRFESTSFSDSSRLLWIFTFSHIWVIYLMWLSLDPLVFASVWISCTLDSSFLAIIYHRVHFLSTFFIENDQSFSLYSENLFRNKVPGRTTAGHFCSYVFSGSGSLSRELKYW